MTHRRSLFVLSLGTFVLAAIACGGGTSTIGSDITGGQGRTDAGQLPDSGGDASGGRGGTGGSVHAGGRGGGAGAASTGGSASGGASGGGAGSSGSAGSGPHPTGGSGGLGGSGGSGGVVPPVDAGPLMQCQPGDCGSPCVCTGSRCPMCKTDPCFGYCDMSGECADTKTACGSDAGPVYDVVPPKDGATIHACVSGKCGDTCVCAGPDCDRLDCLWGHCVSYCDSKGDCVAERPVCSEDAGSDSGKDSGPIYSCEGRACGEACLCAGGDCPKCGGLGHCLSYCDSHGACVAEQPVCEKPDGGTVFSCEGRRCGETCTCTGPGCEIDCLWGHCQKFCDATGTCVGSEPVCNEPACQGRACGDTCVCEGPNCPRCGETRCTTYCNANGACLGQEPVCSTGV